MAVEHEPGCAIDGNSTADMMESLIHAVTVHEREDKKAASPGNTITQDGNQTSGDLSCKVHACAAAGDDFLDG